MGNSGNKAVIHNQWVTGLFRLDSKSGKKKKLHANINCNKPEDHVWLVQQSKYPYQLFKKEMKFIPETKVVDVKVHSLNQTVRQCFPTFFLPRHSSDIY